MGFSHDPIGNRTASTEGSEQKSYQANLLNEYTTAAGATLSYDADGNLTSDGTRRFVYDAENRLVLVEPITAANGSTRVRMAYDYLGKRMQKVVEEFDGSAWAQQDDVRFVYMGWNVIEERHTSAGITTKKNFVWGLDLSQSTDGAGGIGGLLAVVDEAGRQMAFLYDANGNVGQLVDEQGSVVARYEYDPFGNVLGTDGPAASENAYRFSTKYADQETELVYYGYRYYSSGLGRWTQRDPRAERGFVLMYGTQPADRGEPTGHADPLYVAAFNAMTYRFDLLGLWSPGAHDALQAYAFDRLLEPTAIRVLQTTGRVFDTNTQASWQSYLHGMRARGQSASEAKAKTTEFIRAAINETRKFSERKQCIEALLRFAEALHPVMDRASPAHTDASGDPIEWRGVFSFGVLHHSPTDFLGDETREDITQAIFESLKREMRGLYKEGFGECGYCRWLLEVPSH